MIPNIEIEWNYFKDIDEVLVDDLRPLFGIILLTLIKKDDFKLVAYDTDEKVWALMH